MSAAPGLRRSRLAELLDRPGGMRMEEALERAARNLDGLKGGCAAELRTQLDQAEAAYARLGGRFDETGLLALYASAARAVGAGAVCGAPAVDAALGSFCDLLDNLLVSGRLEAEAIEVHLGVWRLLAAGAPPTDGVEAMLEGLRRVSARYADADAA